MTPQSLQGTIKNGKIEFTGTGSEIWLELNEGKDIVISVVKETKRTDRQNRALHKYFELVAEEMEEAGYDLRTVIKAPITPTPYLVKEQMWKPIQEKLTGKESTTELNVDEIDRVYKIMDEAMARSLKISVPFPSEPDERY